MRTTILTALLLSTLAVPVQAQVYPVEGKWGQTSGGDNGPIDCSGKRVIEFNGDQRTDSTAARPPIATSQWLRAARQAIAWSTSSAPDRSAPAKASTRFAVSTPIVLK